MIKLNPRERLTIPQVLSHSWLKETNEDDSEEEEDESRDNVVSGTNGVKGSSKDNGS
jgi:hypothetical protein